MTDFDDNSAGRLLSIIANLKESRRNQYSDFHVHLAEVLEVSPTDPAEFARPFLLVLELPDRIKADISRIDARLYNPELIMQWHAPVRSALEKAVFLHNPLTEFQRLAGQEEMLSLRFASDLLHRLMPERVISETELERVTRLLDELDEDLRLGTQIDSELRAFLLGHVNAMSRAIRDMPIAGSAALESALDQTVGALHRRSDLVARGEDSPSVWAKFGNLIVVVAAIFQIAGAQIPLPAAIRHELTGPPGGLSGQVVIEKPTGTSGGTGQPADGHNGSSGTAPAPGLATEPGGHH
jgi:hypothetical protein